LVLVVEDSVEVRAILVTLLTHDGFAVLEAGDGAQAVAAARESRPDVVLMDLALPVMDGLSAARALKDDPGTRDVPLLALTGHVSRSVDASRSGFERILVKPCAPPVLLSALRWVVARGARVRSSAG
jgi:CheY-like chemotaxis protein